MTMNFRQLVNKKKEVNIHDDFLGMFGLLVVLWNCFFFCFFLGGHVQLFFSVPESEQFVLWEHEIA